LGAGRHPTPHPTPTQTADPDPIRQRARQSRARTPPKKPTPKAQMTRALLIGLLLSACFSGGRSGPLVTAEPRQDVLVDSALLVADLEALAADSMQGRRTGTEGSAMARRYITSAFARVGLQPFGDSYERPFTFTARDSSTVEGVNIVG